MNLRSALLAFTCLLVTAIFSIYYLANKETYDAFIEGTPIRATVVKVRKGDRPGVKISYVDKGKTEETWSEFASESETTLKPGATVDALRHKRSNMRVAVKSAVHDSEPSPLLLVVAAAFVALGGYVLFLPRMRAKRRAARTSGLDVIVDSLVRTRTVTLLVGGGVAVFGAFMVWLGASGADKTASTGVNVGLGIFGAFVVLVGLAIARQAWGLRSIRGSWILATIEQRPGEIAWMYEQIVRSAAAPDVGTASTVFLWFADGKSYSIAVETEDARALLSELSRRAPHAAVGYSPENEKLYRDDPTRFRPR